MLSSAARDASLLSHVSTDVDAVDEPSLYKPCLSGCRPRNPPLVEDT